MHTRLRKTGSKALKAFDPVFVSSVNQSKRSFSGRKRPPAPSSSLPDGSPAASSSSQAAVFTPEKLRRTFRPARIGERTGDGAVRLRCALQTEKQGKRPPKASAASSAPFAGTEGAESPGGDPASRFAAGSSKKRQKLSRLTGRGGRIGPPLPVRRY